MEKRALIQVAFDLLNSDEAFKTAEDLLPFVDCLEVGTPMLYRYGVNIIQKMKDRFGMHTVLADFKIADAGYEEASLAFENGADIVTVLGISHDSTITAAVKAARYYQKRIYADLLCEKDIVSRAKQLIELGVDIIGVHTAKDEQQSGKFVFNELELLRDKNIDYPIAIAGGLSSENIHRLLKYKPYQIVVGQSLVNAKDRIDEAKKLLYAVNHPESPQRNIKLNSLNSNV